MKFITGILTLLLTATALHAGFHNNGKMQSRVLNLNIGGTLENNGELVGLEAANINCETFTGKGRLKSPRICIKTKYFAYTGRIDCSEECLIITSEPFKEKMFRRKGRGNFIIQVDPSLWEEKKEAPQALGPPLRETDESILPTYPAEAFFYTVP